MSPRPRPRCLLGALAGLGLSALALATPALGEEPPKTWTSCTEHLPKGAQRPELHAELPAKGTIGWASTLELSLKHGKGETVLPEGFRLQPSSDAAKALSESGFVLPDPRGGAAPALTRDPSGESTRVSIPLLTLPKQPGRQLLRLPPLPVVVARANGEQLTLCTGALTITVEDPTASEPDPKVHPNPEGRPQREPWELARRLTWGILLGILLTLLGLWQLRRWRRRPRPEPLVKPKLPWLAALEELEALRQSSLLAEGQTGLYFDRVSDCLRRYLGARYGFDGLESTSDEIRRLLGRVRPPVTELPAIVAFLGDCDLVKFARLVPGESD
jgi:hypothetical protein